MAKKKAPLVDDYQRGRMIHKLLVAKSGGHSRYSFGRWHYKPGHVLFTDKQVFGAFGVSRMEGLRLLAIYRASLPWSSEKDRVMVIEVARRRKMSPQLILGIRNQTLRKDCMEAYGLEQLIRDGGGKNVQSDDFGKLWRLDFREGKDTFAMFAEVVNTTPEPDGHYAHYFLRVPPATKTCRDAVAWIGGLNQNQTMEFAGFAAQS